MDAIELLNSHEKSAKAAILDVTNGTIGAGTDPISFVICAFRSQADKIKELTAKQCRCSKSKSQEKRFVAQWRRDNE